MLNALGFDAGPADGVAGQQTLDALNAFQLANGLPVTSSLDRNSVAQLAAIYRNKPYSAPGSVTSEAPSVHSSPYAQNSAPSVTGAPGSYMPGQQPLPATSPNLPYPPAPPHAQASGLTPSLSAAPQTSQHGGSAVDCTSALTVTEQAICGNAVLKGLDNRVSAMYAERLGRSGPEGANVMAEQQHWLTERNRCGADPSCLLTSYGQRLAGLHATSQVGAITTPGANSTGMADNGSPSGLMPRHGLDVVGIQLGMRMDEAEAIIRKHMEVGRVLTGKRLHDGAAAPGVLVPASSGKLFISRDERELIAIVDEPPAAAGKVLGVWRRLYLAPNSLPLDEAVAGLREKYGDPSPTAPVREGMNRWHTVAGQGCQVALDDIPVLSANWAEDGKAVTLYTPDGKPMPDGLLPGPYRQPLHPQYQAMTSCGPMMMVRLAFDGTRMMKAGHQGQTADVIEQSLLDLGPYMQAFKLNHDAMTAAGGNGGGKVAAGASSARPKF